MLKYDTKYIDKQSSESYNMHELSLKILKNILHDKELDDGDLGFLILKIYSR